MRTASFRSGLYVFIHKKKRSFLDSLFYSQEKNKKFVVFHLDQNIDLDFII
jgi:hypothetical protein